jgi:hypothetical protein
MRCNALSLIPAGPRLASGTHRTWGRLLVALCALAFALLVSAQTRAAAFDVKEASWEGTSEFLALARERLGAGRVRIVAKLDYGALTPKDGVLVLHPEVELEYNEISAFLAGGGRVALLDDFGTADRLLSHYRIFRVQAPLRPARALRDNPALALAIPAVQTVAGQEQNRHPIVAGVDQVVTNHPSALTNPNLTPVLTIPALGEPDATLALTGVIAGRGRLFAMADPSVLINLMLRYPGNRAFAQGLVDYLVEDDTWGARHGVLYVLTNRFDQSGRFGRADGIAGDLSQAAGTVSEALAAWDRDGLPPTVALVIAALCTLGAIAWAGLNALRSYRHLTPRYALEMPLLAQGGLPGRAAVLAAPTTDRALLLAELNGWLEDELADRAGLPRTTAPSVVLGVLAERGTPPALLTRARELLRFARAAENSLVRHRPSGVKAGQVAAHERRVRELLLDLDQSGK